MGDTSEERFPISVYTIITPTEIGHGFLKV